MPAVAGAAAASGRRWRIACASRPVGRCPGRATVEADGCLFVIQDLVPGAPIARLTHSLVDELLRLHAARIGLAAYDDDSRWPDVLIETLTIGGIGYCMHESLRGYDARTARVLDRVEAIGHALDAERARRRRHRALGLPSRQRARGRRPRQRGHRHRLRDDGRRHVRSHDARSELTRDRLRGGSAAAGCSTSACAAWKNRNGPAYVGHLLLRYLDWSIRKGRTEAVDYWLDSRARLFEY